MSKTDPILDEINRLTGELQGFPVESDEYFAVVSRINELANARNTVKRGVDPNVKAQVVANLAGIAAILSFERVGIITSKAMGFVSRLKV